MHRRHRGVIGTILVFTLMAVAALIPLPGHAADPVQAACEFPAGGLFLMEGDKLPSELTLTNGTDNLVTFTVTMRENFHYGREHLAHERAVVGSATFRGELDLGPAYGLGLGPADIVLDIRSSATGNTVLATCTVTIRVLALPDSDGDGLPDEWETKGIDYDRDGDVDYHLEERADPHRKDVFVEMDAMTCQAAYCRNRPRRLSDEAVLAVFWEFAEHGIALHVDRDEDTVTEVEGLLFDVKGAGGLDDFDDIKSGFTDRPCDGRFGAPQERSSANCVNVLGAKRLAFHYALSAHAITGRGTTSGFAELGDDSATTVADSQRTGRALPGGNDFLITLGAWTDDMITANGGLADVEAGTFIHELGHNLGLQHGGSDPINCKPNYTSVMNYLYQFPGSNADWKPDYQNWAHGTLKEDAGLDETGPAVPDAYTSIVYGLNGVRRDASSTEPLDWNGDKVVETAATADVNHIALGDDTTSCPASPKQTLTAWEDWSRLRFNFRESRMFAEGAHRGVTGAGAQEITGEAAQSLHSPIDLAVTKTVDKPQADAGDTLTYTVQATGRGAGTPTNVSLADTLPDGTAVIRSLSALPAIETFTYPIPCTAADGSTVTNKVRISGTNQYGSPEHGTLGDNTATASTTVRRPVPGLTVTATPSVNAGEPISYALEYRNTGTGAASSATITATLPAGVYYSTSLDEGAGPRPTAVIGNPDGTTTLRWESGRIAQGSAPGTIAFTARPSLLHTDGAGLTVPVSARFSGGGCDFAAPAATASTRITAVAPTRDPMIVTLWALRTSLHTPENLARVQATDVRFDTGADGSLSRADVSDAFLLPLLQPRTLRAELLAACLNLATRRIGAETELRSLTAGRLGLRTVGDAVRYAQATLDLPLSGNLLRYTATTTLLAEINSGIGVRWR